MGLGGKAPRGQIQSPHVRGNENQMKISQTITVEGVNLILTLTEHSTGRVLARRVWEDAGKYVCESSALPPGYVQLLIPSRAGIDIKPGSNQ